MSDMTSRTDSEFNELISKAKAALLENDATYSRFKETRRKFWETLMGRRVDDLLTDRCLALQYLTDPNPKCRIAALDILSSSWQPDESFLKTCERIVLEDPDNQVRAIALTVLSNGTRASCDARLANMMGSIVHDDTAPGKLRFAAYSGLFRIAGLPVESWPDPTAFRFPEDVDWDFVDRHLQK